MKWAIAGLGVLVLVAMLLAPDDAPVPERPPVPAPESDPFDPPPIVPDVVPKVVPGEDPPPPEARGPGTDPEDRLVLLLSAHSGGPFANLDSVVVSWDGRRRGVRGPPRTEDGWIVLPRPPGVDKMEIGYPGYERIELDLPKLPRRSKVHLSEADPAAHGTLEFPKGDEVGDVRVELRPLHPDGPDLPEFAVLVRNWRFNENRTEEHLGLHDLPDGDWILEVTAVVDGSVVSAKKEVSVHGTPVDLGDVQLEFGAGIRARVVDADGKVVPQAIIRMCREEEDESKSRSRKADDDEGWVSFRDFEPEMWHRVTAGGLPGPLSKLVLTPKKRGEVASVELEWPGRLVHCVLEVEPLEETDGWMISLEGPVGLGLGFGAVGFGFSVTVDLLPGEYVWTATLTRDDRSRTLKAKLVVPAAESHEAALRFE